MKLICSELTAGCIGIESSGTSDTGSDVFGLEGAEEDLELSIARALVVHFVDGVVGNQVDMALKALKQIGEFVGMIAVIVDAC